MLAVKLLSGRLTHLNARSIRNKTTGINQELMKEEIDIVLFSETWLNSDDTDTLYQFPRYNLFRHDRISVYRGGGLCAYVDENVLYSTDKFKHLNRGLAHIECQWLLSVKGTAKRSLICNIYRPPSGSVLDFCNTLKALLLQIDDLQGYDVFIIGDFNVNALVNNNEKRILYECLDQFNMSQIIYISFKNMTSHMIK